MAVKAIAHSYWRSIKRGARTFESVLDPVKEDVRTLARADVADGIITQEEYQQYIGEIYEPATETV
ncbi:MAG: hypothetical protein ACLR9G_18830 [Flavonifractor plautii]|jgi:hypothetical protein|uniref:XkdX family protein n=1 Tax=Flavonifractor plautii TaxID=292800 RepID=A0AAW6CHX2_FLAPL|nr:hypothetical protein [Flavonifractor plautii]MDB7931343.1 hypothetical protein [Flavonifractor plautii]MDB7933791.1 hypothetical protein [Flavonifractor plautii]MDB7938878.1 hypothetical protein [Flavonifractor plautii]